MMELSLKSPLALSSLPLLRRTGLCVRHQPFIAMMMTSQQQQQQQQQQQSQQHAQDVYYKVVKVIQ